MSYDLILAFPPKPADDLIARAAASVGLTAEGREQSSTFVFSDGRNMFQADGPYEVEAGDIDEALLAAVPQPRWGMVFLCTPAADDGIQLAIACVHLEQVLPDASGLCR